LDRRKIRHRGGQLFAGFDEELGQEIVHQQRR
jgi:hypothetical protein